MIRLRLFIPSISRILILVRQLRLVDSPVIPNLTSEPIIKEKHPLLGEDAFNRYIIGYSKSLLIISEWTSLFYLYIVEKIKKVIKNNHNQ